MRLLNIGGRIYNSKLMLINLRQTSTTSEKSSLNDKEVTIVFSRCHSNTRVM
jgi:hypothetical protein